MLIKTPASLVSHVDGDVHPSQGVHGSLEKEVSHSIWQGANTLQKYHMVKWANICNPEDQGVLEFLTHIL